MSTPDLQTTLTSPEQLHEWLSAAFARRPGWTVFRRQPLRSYQQRMERVTLEWPEAGATDVVFVRVYRGFMSWWTINAPDLPQREQAAWRVAGRTGVPVPETLWLRDAPGPPVAIHRGVSGDPLWKHEWSPALVRDIAAALAAVHAARIEDADRTHLPDIRLSALLPRLAAWAEEAGDAERRRAVDRLADRLSATPERPAAFLHGDFHGGNVLHDGRGVTAVLDWEEAALGDPRIDVAGIYLWRRQEAPELAEAFRARYEERAGFACGPLEPWGDLCELRSQIVGAWVKHALARGLSFPSANPEVWVD
jgi:aminoglycoside phosphotransferase (APT) family kinase protein